MHETSEDDCPSTGDVEQVSATDTCRGHIGPASGSAVLDGGHDSDWLEREHQLQPRLVIQEAVPHLIAQLRAMDALANDQSKQDAERVGKLVLLDYFILLLQSIGTLHESIRSARCRQVSQVPSHKAYCTSSQTVAIATR
jgi:hypothetical protein